MLNQKSFLKSRKFFFICLVLSLILCAELLLKQYEIVNTNKAVNQYNLRIGAEYIALNFLYLLWLRNIKIFNRNIDTKTQGNFTQVLIPSSIFLLLAFTVYPNTKTDIYTYLHSGLMILNGLNPYIVPAKDFVSEVSPYFSWGQTSTYGPISQLFFVISALFLKNSIFLSVYVFKFFCLLFHIFNGFLIWNQLKQYSSRNVIAFAYLVNPILLFEQVSQAHLDVFLCTSLILLTSSILSRSFLISVVLIWVGILTKTLPIIWMPLVFVYLISQKRYTTIILSIFGSITLIFILSFTILNSIGAWTSLTNPGVDFRADRSLHSFLRLIFTNFPNRFPSFLSGKYSYRVYLLSKWITYLAYLILYTMILWSIYLGVRKKSYTENHLLLSIGWTTLLLLLFATPWNPSWYVTILIPLSFLLSFVKNTQARIFVNTVFVFCISSSTYYLLTQKANPNFMLALDGLIAFLPTSLYLIFYNKIDPYFSILRE